MSKMVGRKLRKRGGNGQSVRRQVPGIVKLVTQTQPKYGTMVTGAPEDNRGIAKIGDSRLEAAVIIRIKERVTAIKASSGETPSSEDVSVNGACDSTRRRRFRLYRAPIPTSMRDLPDAPYYLHTARTGSSVSTSLR